LLPLFIFRFLLPSDHCLSSDASLRRLALVFRSGLEPVASASVSADVGSLLVAMPPPKPTPSGLEPVVAK
jgi:hypothetical protein